MSPLRSAAVARAICAPHDKSQTAALPAAQDKNLNQVRIDSVLKKQCVPAPAPTMKLPENRQGRPRLALHLGIVLGLKFALLALLWYLLVMPYRVEVDAPAMGERLTQATPQSNLKEQPHDRSDRR
ncbi:MAG: cytochrome oxidase putative small subunit CydP [Nevskiales bacterium]